MRTASWGIIVGLLLTGCAAGPKAPSGPLVQSLSADALAGASAAAVLEVQFGGLQRDVAAERRMERVGARLVAATPELEGGYQYHLLAHESPNAFSLPGGRIYVTKGLYERLDSDDLLAAVIAHEMAHIAARDSFKPPARDMAEALDREMVADERGAGYLAVTGRSPQLLVDLIQMVAEMQSPVWCAARCQNLTERWSLKPVGEATLAAGN